MPAAACIRRHGRLVATTLVSSVQSYLRCGTLLRQAAVTRKNVIMTSSAEDHARRPIRARRYRSLRQRLVVSKRRAALRGVPV